MVQIPIIIRFRAGSETPKMLQYAAAAAELCAENDFGFYTTRGEGVE